MLFSVKERGNGVSLPVLSITELQESSVIRKYRITAGDSKSYDTKHYNLSAIIAVGYKVNSERAVQFRKWATAIVKSLKVPQTLLAVKQN